MVKAGLGYSIRPVSKTHNNNTQKSDKDTYFMSDYRIFLHSHTTLKSLFFIVNCYLFITFLTSCINFGMDFKLGVT